MKNRHYVVILTAVFFLTPQCLQATTEVLNTINFIGYNNSSFSMTTDTAWIHDQIDIVAGTEAVYNLELFVRSAQNGTHLGRYAHGAGTSSLAVTTVTPWVTDSIGVAISGADDRSVLDQYINSSGYSTHIGRNALFIGEGVIETTSVYNGFNAPGGEGEPSVTGIYIEGKRYGVLIQNGSLEFNADFGGMRESVATAGGDYTVEQSGYVDADISGDFTASNDYGTFISIAGDHSATISSSDFGTSPQSGLDIFQANNISSWATGEGVYFLNLESPTTQLNLEWVFGHGTLSVFGGNGPILVGIDFVAIEVDADFSAN